MPDIYRTWEDKMDKNKAKLKNMLKPIVTELVKEALFSEKGILSGIIQECVSGLTKEVIVEKKVVPNVPVLQEQIEATEQQQDEQSDLERAIKEKKLLQAKEDLERQKRVMQASGFANMFEGIEALDEGGMITEGKMDEAQGMIAADPLNKVKGKGVDITGIMAVAKGGRQGWKNAIKKG